MAINNPYVPGDPRCYDLKWIVRKLKEIASDSGVIYEEITDLIDYDNTTAHVPSNSVKAHKLGKEVYFSINEFRTDVDEYLVKFNSKYTGSSAEYFPLYMRNAPGDPLDVIGGHFRIVNGELDLTDAGPTDYRCIFSGHFTIGG